MNGSVNQYLIRISLFLIAILIVIVFLYPVLQSAFLSNIYINSVILFTLLIGLFFSIYNLIQLQSDQETLSSFNIHKTPQILFNKKGLLKILAQQLTEKDGRYSFKSTNVPKILESIDFSILSKRETSKYLVGLLVFLGLLGTFWGLLKTIGSVGDVINGLGIDDANVAGFFNSLKDGLNAPLKGMSIAFSSSLFGLAGSLILGFVDLQLGQAQNKFSQFVEKIINNNSSIDFLSKETGLDNSSLMAMQKIYDNLDSIVFSLKETSRNQSQIYSYMQTLTDQLKEITSLSREQDKKISNFLSTQLNVQSDILKLTNQLNKNGIIDDKTKKNLQNIDKGIQQLILNYKEK
jgi:hypothetical protein|tara:strand:- start:634 stop:1680 length:1047 start_codon:yes stop_codon:yes gene_type:complete